MLLRSICVLGRSWQSEGWFVGYLLDHVYIVLILD